MTVLAGTFPSVRSCLIVGIRGGIPSNTVRLGDVVVGRPKDRYPGVVQWDMGKANQCGALTVVVWLCQQHRANEDIISTVNSKKTQ